MPSKQGVFVPCTPLASVKAPLRVSVSLARAARQVCEPGLSLSVSCLAPGNYWGRPGTGEDGEDQSLSSLPRVRKKGRHPLALALGHMGKED